MKKSSVKKDKKNSIFDDPNYQFGMKTTLIICMWTLVDTEIVDKEGFDFFMQRFRKVFEMVSNGDLKLQDIINTLKDEYGYERINF